MAATKRTADKRPSGRTVVFAFAGAIGVAVALVVVALVLRNDGTTAATPTPVVDLRGIPQEGARLGQPGAKVTLIEYADQQCPACRAYTENVFPTVVTEYVRPGKVDLEYRGYPFIGSDSVKAERFLLAAGLQNHLWDLQETLYRHQGAENSGWVTDDLIREVASEIPGLDVEKLFADAERPDIVKQAESAADEASAAGVQGTPSLFVKVGDAAPYYIQVATPAQIREALDDALSG